MNKKDIVYIGSFPPPYGGVTIKNLLLYESLSNVTKIHKIELNQVKHFNLRALVNLIVCIVRRQGTLVLGPAGVWRQRLTKILYYLNRDKMKRSILIVMGGRIPEDPDFYMKMNEYKHVYVETSSMKSAFEQRGSNNIRVYPNCRKSSALLNSIKPTGDKIGVVCFSLISPEKGVRIILDCAKQIREIEFNFYGPIQIDYEDEFFKEIKKTKNAHYRGVFDAARKSAVLELHKYDIHLFPTLCKFEGVPGVIVETKMAGVPTIASNRGYNNELIINNENGLITDSDSSEELVAILRKLMNKPSEIDRMKKAALESADHFNIDNYIEEISSDLVCRKG